MSDLKTTFGEAPAARSSLNCDSRITAFFAIMPISARMPRMATKPSGRLNTKSASTTHTAKPPRRTLHPRG